MPVRRYVFLNPDTVRAVEYTGANVDEVLAAFPDTLHDQPDEDHPYFADDNGNYTTVEPGMMVVEFHDGALAVFPRAEFLSLYELEGSE
jgi:hypothetical protein